jgi:hypothetical protein
MSQEDVGWGATRFSFPTDSLDKIIGLLKCNNRDIVKVFDVLWHDGTICKYEAVEWLRLLDVINKSGANSAKDYLSTCTGTFEVFPSWRLTKI